MTQVTTDVTALQAYQWSRQPRAEAFIRDVNADFLRRCPAAAHLAEQMRERAGTRFQDWIDSVDMPDTADVRAKLAEAGYVAEEEGLSFHQPEGMFPPLRLRASGTVRVALKVESVADFLAAHQMPVSIFGEPLGQMRYAIVGQGDDGELVVVERHGWAGMGLPPVDESRNLRAVHHLDLMRRRRRVFTQEAEGFRHARELINDSINDLGVDWTCTLFFAAEREFWQRRNRAAQVQKARQDQLGLGWANHDHHTYRSSRKHFAALIGVCEMLGLHCRERFYAGREAGWGAQVMEHPGTGIVVFADVDLAPEELLIDFAHEPLQPRDTLGTVGLWCGLHGEAFLQAGMHHLECQFDFAALKKQLEAEHGITVMKPFTDYPFLRQAFTEGERWPVREGRLQNLLAGELITPAQAEQFRCNGAIGSHLENLERNEGYKGFNQKGVSEVIAATDPRLHVAR